ncbi:heparinase II/III domain-containing protein [Wenyingzhuangia sp. IMCC45574]
MSIKMVRFKGVKTYLREGLILILFLSFLYTNAQNRKRPFILVQESDKEQVLKKIKTTTWGNKIYTKLARKTNVAVKLFKIAPEKILEQLPFENLNYRTKEFPAFRLTDHVVNGVHKNLDNATREEWEPAQALIDNLQLALDCGVMYYLTEDKQYAALASSILYSFVKSSQKSTLSSWHARGGWLFPYDGFREVRVLGYRIPLIYDFIAPYLQSGGKAFDLLQHKYVEFPIHEVQDVFKTYASITVHYGHTGSNHSVLEAPSLVYNALAMDNPEERERWLSYFLTTSTKHQDALDVMAKNYKEKGDIWPETSQYLNHSTAILAKLMLVVNRYNPSLNMSKKYPNVLFALPRLDYFVYPNQQIIRWGDGHRHGHAPYEAIENAYRLAKMDNNTEVTDELGPILSRVLKNKQYNRKELENLFWSTSPIDADPSVFKLPRTDKVFHAGIVMQRNISTTNNAKDGLMCFVGGAHMVHGHAEGMNIELYGEGEVLGVDNGRGRYAKDIHENYSRLYAAHNTVIVNGSSRGKGGWSNLGINKVKVLTMEPQINTKAISPNYSFSQTSFKDTKGEKAEADQERTLALVRTSPTTGYYVDVFRSKSTLPNEFHDYLYHNIGDKLVFNKTDLKLKSTPNRYMESSKLEWGRGKYRNPGWHFFDKVYTSKPYSNNVKVTFLTEKLKDTPVYMDMHIVGFPNREYSKVKAPATYEAPKAYKDKKTPTVVIRNNGEAWEKPFAVVFEPYNASETPTVDTVEKLEENGIYKGLIVKSTVGTDKITQYILTLSKGQEYNNASLGLSFKGIFAIVTLKGENKLKDVYVGNGTQLVFKNNVINLEEGTSFYKEYK